MRIQNLTRALFFFFVACLMTLSWTANARNGVFNPESFYLNNGMQVVVASNHRIPVVTHMVWYKAGSAEEEPGKSGAAHLLEHLMFKGTKTMPSGAFSKAVARNGGSENAFTSLDYTGYYQTVAVDRLEDVMKMEADRMTNLVLTPEEIETERLVVLEERRQRTDNNPGAILREHVNAALFLNHPYRRPIIGWAHEIAALGKDDLERFYRRWYAPNNAILVVAGDITAKELRPLAEKTYGKILPAPSVSRTRAKEPPQSASRRIELKHARVRQPAWNRTYLAPNRKTPIQGGPGTEHADALEVLSEILGSGSTSPLYRSIVIDKKLAVSAGLGYGSGGIGPSRLSFYASPRSGVDLETLETAMEAEIEKLLTNGISAKEVERARTRMLAEAVFARDSLSAGARVLGATLASGGTIDDVESWPQRMAAVTVGQVNDAFRAVVNGRPSVTSLLLLEDEK